MNNCKVKGLFNPELHTRELSALVSAIYNTVKNLPNKELQFYYELKDIISLGKGINFVLNKNKVGTTVTKANLSSNIDLFIENLLEIIRNHKNINLEESKLRSILNENLKVDMGLTGKYVNPVSTQENADIPGGEGEAKVEEEESLINFNQFLHDTYGINQGANYLRHRKFEKQLFNHTVCNFLGTNPTGDFIQTVDDLNRYIIKLKNELYNTIKLYILNIHPNVSYPETLYLPTGELSPDYRSVINDFKNYIEEFANLDEQILSGYFKRLKNESDAFLDALDAYTNLVYFDDEVENIVGRYIRLSNKGFKNQEVNFFYKKYRFAVDHEHKRNSWNEDGDARTAAQNTSKWSKMVLNQIPLETDFARIKGTTVGIVNLQGTYSKLFLKVNQFTNENSTNDLRRIREAILNMHKNHIGNIAEITRLAAESLEVQAALKKAGFSPTELAVFKSMYQYVFAFTAHDMQVKSFSDFDSKTLKAILTKKRRLRINIGRYTILEDICAIIRDSVDSTYLATNIGYDNSVSVKYRPKSKRQDSAIHKLVSKINSRVQNVSPNVYKIWELECTITPLEAGTYTEMKVRLNFSEPIEFTISNDKEMGILALSREFSYTNIEKFKYLNRAMQEILNVDTVQFIEGVNLDSSLQLVREILKFVDSRLGTLYLTLDGITTLLLQLLLNPDLLTNDLIPLAIKAQIIAGIYSDFKSQDEIKSFYNYLYKKTPFAAVITNYAKAKNFVTRIGETYELITTNPSNYIESYVQARSILTEQDINSVSKNVEGNNDANVSTAYLGALIQQINAENKELKLAGNLYPTNHLLFTENGSAIKLHVIDSDLRAGSIRKLVKNAKVKELLFHSIFHGFFDLTEGIIILPTTYSDKTKYIQYVISPNHLFELRDGTKVNLNKMSLEQTKLLYFDTIGNFIKTLYSNIHNKLCTILGLPQDATVSQINEVLKTKREEDLILLAVDNNMDLELDTEYRVLKDANGNEYCAFNELLDYQANYLYANEANFRSRLEKEKNNFINDLKSSGVKFYIGYKDTKWNDVVAWIGSDAPNRSSIAKAIASRYSTAKAILEYLDNWVKNGKLIINKGSNLNPLLEEYFYKYSLLSNNLRLSLTGSEIGHPDKSKERKNLAKQLELIDPNVATQFKQGLIDYTDLMNNPNEQIKTAAINSLEIIENIAQGTQLKRNVVIPGTMHYIQPGDLTGIGYYTKVAVIKDIDADVWNYINELTLILAHDGSAFICSLQSRLENNSLQSQEVGVDKKPLWHAYSHSTGTAQELKFATFEITNLRIRDSIGSKVSLLNIVRKMYSMLWSGDWVVNGGLLGNNKLNPRITRELTWTDYTKGKPVYYRNAKGEYIEITNFGRDENGNYFTEECKVDILGFKEDAPVKVYHFFDSFGNHYNELLEGTHTINSLYELWETLGGAYSMEKGADEVLIYSENSNDLLVEFVNNVVIRKPDGDIYDLTQNSYYLPLKDCFIGYLSNNTAFKNGAKNRNSASKWYTSNNDLFYFNMDNRFLGIQMDASHDVEEAKLTEFSLVLTALEAGGRLHDRSKLTYKDLQKVARVTASLELDSTAKIISAAAEGKSIEEVKSDLYKFVGDLLLDNLRENDNGLANEILNKIAKRFNINRNHLKDPIKIPFSDPSIYSMILSTYVSNLNNKSIKRKYPGSGFVMVPAYNIIEYYKIPNADGTFRKLKFDDVLEEALEAGITSKLIGSGQRLDIVNLYLQSLKPTRQLVSQHSFVPTDVVDIVTDDNTEITIELSNLKIYRAFANSNWEELLASKIITQEQYNSLVLSLVNKFYQNITIARNLAPSRVTWKYKDESNVEHSMNLFLLPEVEQGKGVQSLLDNLAKGFFTKDGKAYQIYDLVNEPAEMIVSNGYASIYGLEGKSLAEIEKEGPEAFAVIPPEPVESTNWDIAFGKGNGELTYITFDKKKAEANEFQSKVPWKKTKVIKSKDGALNVWNMSNDNVPLFKVGRLVVNDNIEYIPEVKDITGRIKSKAKFIGKKTKLPITNTSGLSVGEDGKVYEYIEYLTKYNRVEHKLKNGKVIGSVIYDSYSINVTALNRVFTSTGNKEADEANKANFVRSILDDIYNSANHSTLHINTVLSGIAPNIIRSSVKGMKNLPDYYKTDLLNPIINEIDAQRLDQGKDVIDLSSLDMDAIQEELYSKLKNERYSCWKQSLIYTAARIPAQSLQSFMQMQAIAYTGNSQNVVHVSHFLTYLQGSDYDIDKAYIMGLEIDETGLLVKYSDIMDFSTPELVKASLRLPTPSNITLTNAADGVDITEELLQILNNSPTLELLLLNAGKALIKINNIYDYNPIINARGNKEVRYTYDPTRIRPAEVNSIISGYLQKHEWTDISPTKQQKAFKVAIAANIGNIVQDIRNADQSYRPITMDDLHEVADTSEKSLRIKSMSLMNPATIFNMQVQNMVGKKVIGIAAVGEKVFFNLSFYWNEALRSRNQERITNLKFEKTFNRILNRYNASKGIGEIESVTKKSLSNVNFEGSEDFIGDFTSADLRKRAEAEATMEFVKNPQLTDAEKEQIVKDIVYKYFTNQKETDLMISQVLSAATDNAKELILAKINCDENLAKCYIHLLIMGFDIKDIISFMTSPVVETIAYFSESNMFDVFNPEMSLNDAINILDGKIQANNFVSGIVYNKDEDTGEVESIEKIAAVKNYIVSMLNKAGLDSEETGKISSANEAIEVYIKERLKGNPDLINLSEQNILDYQRSILYDYIEDIITKLQETISKYKNADDFYADLLEFKNLIEGADETSSLGNVFLGMNLGLATDKAGLLTKIKKIKDMIKNRENKFGLKFFALEYNKEGATEERKNILLNNIVKVLLQNNPALEEPYVRNVLVDSLDIIDNFDIEKWLYNIDNYRNRVSNYYNILKVQWNVFDVVNTIPQYKEILELLKSTYVVDKYMSLRSDLVNSISSDIINRFNFIDDTITKKVSDYIRDLLIINYFEDHIIEFPVLPNWETFDAYLGNVVSEKETKLNLATAEGRASFKRIMEEHIIPSLQNGDYSFIESDEIPYVENNPFIKALSVDLDRESNTFLTLDIDMININTTPTTMLKYQQYLSGLSLLDGVHIGNKTLLDWLVLYNLIVNQNMYGSDRLTKVFSGIVQYAQNSTLNNYYSYLGELDYRHPDDLLVKLGYDLQDVLIRLAKTTYSEPNSTDRELCYKYIDENGKVTYLIKGKKGYSPVSIYPQRDLEASDFNVDLQAKINYQKHWTMPMKNKTNSDSIHTGLLSSNVDDIVKSLRLCMLYGLVFIYPTNCD